jgi:hypothetical protein
MLKLQQLNDKTSKTLLFALMGGYQHNLKASSRIMLESKIRDKNAQTSRTSSSHVHHGDQANSTAKDRLEIAHPLLKLLKPFGLGASSIVSMAIVLSGSPVWAEGQFLILRDSQNTDFELNFLLSLEPSIENSTTTSFDDSVLNIPTQGLHHFPTESGQDTLENPDYLAQALQQASPLAVEPSTGNTESIEASFPINAIAQDAELEPPNSVSQSTGEPTEIEPTEIEPIEPTTPSAPTIQDDEPTQPSESLSSPTPTNRWQFSAEPYFFVPLGVQADITVDGRSTSLDFGLDDVLNLDRAFDAGLRLQAQNNRWGIILDGFYISAEDSGRLGQTFSAGSLLQFVQRTAPRSLEQFVQQFDAERLQEIGQLEQAIGLNTPVRITANGKVTVRQITADLALSYRVVDTSLNDSLEEADFYPRLIVAPILGVRTNFLRQTIEVDTIRIDNLPIPDDALPRIDRNFRFSRTLVEPLLGAQIGLGLSERWTLGLRGDVSGFNIGADQNLTWNLLAGVQYRLSRLASLQLGYRFNSFDFEDGEGFRRAKLSLRQNGLWLGAMFQF